MKSANKIGYERKTPINTFGLTISLAAFIAVFSSATGAEAPASQSLVPAAKLDTQKISLCGKTEKAFYAPGKTMTFTFTVDYGNQAAPKKPYIMKWRRTGDDGRKASGTETVIPDKPIVVKASANKPGFIRIQADLVDDNGRPLWKKYNGKLQTISFDGGAGVEPEKLQSAVTEPADFDKFWAKQKLRLAAVPMKYKMKKVSKPGEKVNVYVVSVDCAGPRPVTGYLTIPAGAKDKSLPALVQYDGYGTTVQRVPQKGMQTRPQDKIYFHVNAHGYDLDKDAAYYQGFFDGIKSNGCGYAFDPKQNSDPETAYFNGMALRVMRSLEFIKSLPQWNGKDLTVTGASQGGMQTIWAAGLDPDVSVANTLVTWCCDIAGPTKERLSGWRPEYLPALEYYDSVFHAKRIKCPVNILRAGLGDYVCPPSGLAVLYNSINTPKKIVWYQGTTHGYLPKNPQKFEKKQK